MAFVPLIHRADGHLDRVAVVDDAGRFTYAELLDRSARAAMCLLDTARDLQEARVAFMVPPSMQHVVVQWGIWRAGGIAVPLCMQHPTPELEYTIDDSGAATIVAHPEFADQLSTLAKARGLRLILLPELDSISAACTQVLPDVAVSRRAMLLYTSGTTNKPKGVVTTHEIITAQIQSLVQAWDWTRDDHILHVLPLHHLHGILNVMCCALWAGATCEFLSKFDVDRVWQRIAAGNGLSLFMAVPTIYTRLTRAWDSAAPDWRQIMTDGCRKMRLMVSGSAALPVPVLEKWRAISGHTLLERYGMTEIGMALSNPLHGERRPGCVGTPLPEVAVRLVDEGNQLLPDGQPGQIQVRGPTVFSQYWRKPDVTDEAFTSDGWFKTGDVAECVKGVYRILGRESVDIIKTGGYKVSALEIEDVLRTHDGIDDCAVVGVEDEEWGQRVAAAVVQSDGHQLDLKSLRTWCKKRLATYKVPSMLLIMGDLPRNPMGKVTKPDIVKQFNV
jgi:malonyl-CoA/methylmalonyl-CoA synthetase